MAYDAGLIAPDMRVCELLGDEMPPLADPGWRGVTLDQLMCHRAGYGRGWLDIDVDDASEYAGDDYLALAMREKLVHAPGAAYQYTDAAYYIVSRIVEHAVNKPLDVTCARCLWANSNTAKWAGAAAPKATQWAQPACSCAWRI